MSYPPGLIALSVVMVLALFAPIFAPIFVAMWKHIPRKKKIGLPILPRCVDCSHLTDLDTRDVLRVTGLCKRRSKRTEAYESPPNECPFRSNHD